MSASTLDDDEMKDGVGWELRKMQSISRLWGIIAQQKTLVSKRSPALLCKRHHSPRDLRHRIFSVGILVYFMSRRTGGTG